nr:MAG TPA: hypothetical protein [Caudoviricetes sp.]
MESCAQASGSSRAYEMRKPFDERKPDDACDRRGRPFLSGQIGLWDVSGGICKSHFGCRVQPRNSRFGAGNRSCFGR